jgi:hypothetical protein
LAINDLILRRSGGSWDAPPKELYFDKLLQWKMKRFLGRLHRDGTAVWKDPRTTLTFPLWKPLLKSYRILATFRHPMSVARSLKRRDGVEIEKGIELWRSYNERLLEICANESDVAWIDFDLEPQQYVGVLDRFVAESGLNANREAMGFYRPELRTSDAQEKIDSKEIVALHARLKERVRQAAESADTNSSEQKLTV